jgi:hypothetical protein
MLSITCKWAYRDANWSSDSSDRQSLSPFCVFLGGSLIVCKTKKQVIVSHSSAKTELRAMVLVIEVLSYGGCSKILVFMFLH